VVLRDDEGVAPGQWVDVEEGEDLVRLEELEGWDVSCEVTVSAKLL
jgi:hypothetical protein